MPAVVCNASPLIVLAKAGLLDVLPRLFDLVLMPAAVEAEIMRGPADDPMHRHLATATWLRRVRLDPPLSPLAAWQLGPGEAEVIEYARLHPDHGAILDDRAARRAAARCCWPAPSPVCSGTRSGPGQPSPPAPPSPRWLPLACCYTAPPAETAAE
jgi:predicted nucleic acid-binding protein